MLDYFFNKVKKSEEGREIFEKLKIGKVEEGKYMDYYGNYIVIGLDLKSLEGSNLMGSFSKRISQLYNKHLDILKKIKKKSEEERDPVDKSALQREIQFFENFLDQKHDNNLSESLTFLVELISKHYNEEIVILIDEIDCGIMNFIYSNINVIFGEKNSEVAKKKREECIKYLEFFHNFLSGVCKPEFSSPINRKTKFIILSGITDVCFNSSKLNTVMKFDMKTGLFQNHYGATPSELEKLIDDFFVPISKEDKDDLLSKLRGWYKGYYFPDNQIEIYNIWSIMNYFRECKFLHSSGQKVKFFEPKSFWAQSDQSIILKKIKNLCQNQTPENSEFLENLMKLVQGMETSQNFYDTNLNLYCFLTDDEQELSVKIFPDILISTGYITASKSGSFKIPNNEILYEFKKKVISSYVSFLKLELNFRADLSDNLNDDEKFEGNIKKMLENVRYDRNEDYFKSLIFAVVELQHLENPEKSKYLVLTEKFVDESGGKIDHAILATKNNDVKTDLIHEYKVLHKTTMDNYSIKLNDALWQVYCKNYISDPLAKQLLNNEPNWKIKVRPIVFIRNENTDEWSMKMKNFQFDENQAKNIFEFFKNISTNLKNLLSNHNQSKTNELRANFLEIYGKSSIEEFVEMVSTQKIDILHGSFEDKLNSSPQNKKKNENKREEVKEPVPFDKEGKKFKLN